MNTEVKCLECGRELTLGTADDSPDPPLAVQTDEGIICKDCWDSP
jgi:DNA-directed RNA polymerase subunit RPC12/RpoP